MELCLRRLGRRRRRRREAIKHHRKKEEGEKKAPFSIHLPPVSLAKHRKYPPNVVHPNMRKGKCSLFFDGKCHLSTKCFVKMRQKCIKILQTGLCVFFLLQQRRTRSITQTGNIFVRCSYTPRGGGERGGGGGCVGAFCETNDS